MVNFLALYFLFILRIFFNFILHILQINICVIWILSP